MYSSGEESDSSGSAVQKQLIRAPAMVASASEGQRSCTRCNTTETPLWRNGPAGPKSLCNACGIRQIRKKRELMALNCENDKCKRARTRCRFGVSYKLKLLGLSRDAVLQRYLFLNQTELAEEEEAALLLMALSCGLMNA